ncbi:MAG: 4-vinyl reductase [Eubacteriales bacterium]|nr:4-vinyl reductase [Eubacteriales bacterium]
MESIDRIREQLANLRFDNNARREMNEKLREHPELSRYFASCYDRYERGEGIRPTLGSEMPIFYMRERQTLAFLLFPELLQTQYEISRVVGENICADQIRGKTLPEIMQSNLPIAEHHKYAFEELVEADEKHAVYRHYECADCYGVPNIGMKICVHEAGVAAGMFSTALGRPVTVTETKCCANGDDYCEFFVEVQD